MAKVAVVGGGIAGLAAAHRLIERARDRGRPLELTLLEAGPRVGGAIDTRLVGENGEYLVEAGPDAFITNKPWAVDLCRRLGLKDRLIPTDERYRRSLVVRDGRPVPVPEGFLLLAPARVWPVLRSPLFTWRGKLRMGLEYFVPRRTDEGDESLASFVRRRFGREALERLVQPLVGGIYTADPERLSLAATLPRFLEMERRYRSLIRASRKQSAGGGLDAADAGDGQQQAGSGARYGLFAAPSGGMSELVTALERAVSAAGTIRTSTAVVSLRPVLETGVGFTNLNSSGRTSPDIESASTGRIEICEPDPEMQPPASGSAWELRVVDSTVPDAPSVRDSSGRAERFDAVVLALPAWRAAELVAAFDAALAAELRGIEYASSAIVATGHRLADVAHPLDAAGLVVPAIERRRILAVSFASRKFAGRAPEGRAVLRTFVGGALQPELLAHSDDELIQIVRGELAELLGVGGREEFAFVARHERAMPQYHVGHLERAARIERERAKHPGLALAGNAYEGVGIPDCIRSGERAADAVSGWPVP